MLFAEHPGSLQEPCVPGTLPGREALPCASMVSTASQFFPVPGACVRLWLQPLSIFPTPGVPGSLARNQLQVSGVGDFGVWLTASLFFQTRSVCDAGEGTSR